MSNSDTIQEVIFILKNVYKSANKCKRKKLQHAIKRSLLLDNWFFFFKCMFFTDATGNTQIFYKNKIHQRKKLQSFFSIECFYRYHRKAM